MPANMRALRPTLLSRLRSLENAGSIAIPMMSSPSTDGAFPSVSELFEILVAHPEKVRDFVDKRRFQFFFDFFFRVTFVFDRPLKNENSVRMQRLIEVSPLG